ncbi:5-methyltetrahydropteroyltriglutamate--homocysteine S-methyltransferase [Streptococcus devriesei]|uniref:5-methyltetrahydropteroyltriglutamate-- homocysteine S-methyltransferase n=1 Tax=Streptococcus devriesei TaxID=231233 RepID=UPI0003F6D876|nr:5-methyltetrahydropteroyltriglutamate--homocysteine S-methyltransferase [Streptococcus devriesei]
MTKKYFEHVGSFLRPAELKEARQAFESGKISREELTAIEDRLITDLVDKEVTAGLEKVTDGEFRRANWHVDFFWGFDGIERSQYGQGLLFQGVETNDDSAVVSGKIRFVKDHHPFIQHYRFLKKLADERGVEAKITIPAPAQCLVELQRGKNIEQALAVYPDQQELIEDLAAAYHQAILAFYEEGARTVQLDDCTWGIIMDDDFYKTVTKGEVDKDAIREGLLYINNKALENLPDDLTINTHICRGNYQSTYATSGPYTAVAETLFGRENATSYFLEYDTDRAGGFEPLAAFKNPDKVAVLGLITTKDGQLEDKEAIIKRIREAQKVLPLDQLWLATQCGFASTQEGNLITEQDQWKKLALVKEILDEVWG